MAENGKKSAGKDILDGIRNISEEDWDRSVTQAEEAEKESARRMAQRMKEDMDKKKLMAQDNQQASRQSHRE